MSSKRAGLRGDFKHLLFVLDLGVSTMFLAPETVDCI